ncbi:glycosyl hydrolase family 65 protein [Sphaerisporangium fuscum]|uniref:glycosyl hydrolase family 65 protein n=1 Tax=Sphaerisporangium fuscum TaxID=2835868 RepID=UPI001BDD96FB|nr:glycosyl hydrolase family 65 protein [Sphaerisporangium fuscum]
MEISSSCPEVVEMFEWATRRALRWAHPGGTRGPVDADETRPEGTGEGVYLPSYWAGYAHRSGFYSRDFVHQLPAAHLLGLDEANLTMLKCFAASATKDHGYHPVWAFNFDGSYLSLDYRGPDDFVREVPAVFELVEAAEAAYRWTGDRSYVEDPVLWAFYRHATGEFVELHGGGGPVARGTGGGIFQGTATYNELDGEPLAEAGDGIAAQYRAYLAMAALARARGEDGEPYNRAARRLRDHFARFWGGYGAGQIRGYTTGGDPVTGWGQENSFFMPLKGIMPAGPRNEAYLDYVDAQASGPGRPPNIEALTYLPDLFFRNGRPATAWKWMREIFAARDLPHVAGGRNGDYPEVAFTLVGQVVEGLLGVRPDAPSGEVTVEPALPPGIDRLEVSGIPVGGRRIAVRHDRGTTTVTDPGPGVPLRVTAIFADGSR